MKGVATIGKKGGNGKTTLAHLLALGACWKAVPAHFMHTDDRSRSRSRAGHTCTMTRVSPKT